MRRPTRTKGISPLSTILLSFQYESESERAADCRLKSLRVVAPSVLMLVMSFLVLVTWMLNLPGPELKPLKVLEFASYTPFIAVRNR